MSFRLYFVIKTQIWGLMDVLIEFLRDCSFMNFSWCGFRWMISKIKDFSSFLMLWTLLLDFIRSFGLNGCAYTSQQAETRLATVELSYFMFGACKIYQSHARPHSSYVRFYLKGFRINFIWLPPPTLCSSGQTTTKCVD